jgi:hypothetical protein
MSSKSSAGIPAPGDPVDYEKLVGMFNAALIHTLRKHSVAGSFLDFWVPDADPVLGIAGMVDSARINGIADIAIRFRKSTVPQERLAELRRALDKVCTLTLDDEGDTVLLRAKDMKQSAAAGGTGKVKRPAPVYWRPTSAAGSKPDETRPGWERETFPEFADVHPYFRPALSAASAAIAREGAPAEPAPGTIRVEGRDGPVTLALSVDTATKAVRAARHSGAANRSERAIMDLFCKMAEGQPIQEVADHLCLKLLDSMVDEDAPPPVKGVLLPANAGRPFTLPARLARLAYDAYRARTGAKEGTNFYYPSPTAEWLGLSAEQRAESADRVLRAFLQSSDLYPDDIVILRIEKNKYGFPVRIIVAFSDRVAVADKPTLMRKLESRLRRDAEGQIDLVAERAKDTSPLRRLS